VTIYEVEIRNQSLFLCGMFGIRLELLLLVLGMQDPHRSSLCGDKGASSAGRSWSISIVVLLPKNSLLVLRSGDVHASGFESRDDALLRMLRLVLIGDE
jgi:hypothetical protein